MIHTMLHEHVYPLNIYNPPQQTLQHKCKKIALLFSPKKMCSRPSRSHTTKCASVILIKKMRSRRTWSVFYHLFPSTLGLFFLSFFLFFSNAVPQPSIKSLVAYINMCITPALVPTHLLTYTFVPIRLARPTHSYILTPLYTFVLVLRRLA